MIDVAKHAEAFRKALEGKKTFIVTGLIVLLNTLNIAGLVPLEPQQIEAVNYLLVATGLTTLRLGIKK